jgi:DNA-binding SARP family transcriptional activator
MMLEIHLFSTGRVHYFDQSLVGFPQQQPFLLFCYLILNRGRPHHREPLAATFWGEYPPEKARKYLRNALWRLRQALQQIGAVPDEYILIDEDSIAFLTASQYWLDVEVFEQTLNSVQHISGPKLSGDHAEELTRAVSLYTGDLLEGVYEDWCLYERERLNLLYLNALSKLMIFHGLHNEYAKGLACGERILMLDQTREKIHRLMMWLYWLSGDRNAALAQYKRCAQILREALGAKPMTETNQLYQEMVHDQFNPQRWMEERDHPSPVRSSGAASLQPVANHLLKRLQRLQQMVDDTSAEIRQLEHLISITLIKRKRTE